MNLIEFPGRNAEMTPWRTAPQFDYMPLMHVYVWRIRLDTLCRVDEALWNLLDANEKLRVACFLRIDDRVRAVTSRGILRLLLGSLLRMPASAVPIGYGTHGKPHLIGPHMNALKFNCSHSGEWVLIALSTGGEVGVDVECWRKTRVPLGERVSSAAPCSPSNLFASDRCASWTRQEAYVKALGLGLSKPLNSFRVTRCSIDKWEYEETGVSTSSQKWASYQLDMPENYEASVVYQTNVIKLCFMERTTFQPCISTTFAPHTLQPGANKS